MEKLVKYGEEFIFYISLKTTGSDSYQANPTLAAGDVKVTQDGVDFGNIDTIPVVTPAGGTQIKVTVSVAELTGKQIQIQFIDAAGAEWKADTINISTYGYIDAQYPFFGEGLLDRVLTGSTHNIIDSLARRIRNLQEFGTYENGNVYIDTVNGSGGTTLYESGTVFNSVDTLADANIIGADPSLNLTGRHIAPLSSIVFDTSQEGQTFCGENWTLALGEQSISGTHIKGADVSGICSGASEPEFHECSIGNVTIPSCAFRACDLNGIIILPAGEVHLHDCSGESGLVLDYGATIANTTVHATEFSGDLIVDNLGANGIDVLDIRGHGKITLNASCVGGTINWDGHFTIVNNGSGVTINSDDISANVDAIIAADIPGGITILNTLVNAIDTSTELAARFDQIKGIGWIDETLISIRTAIASIGGIQGANAITIQMYETGGTTPIVDDTIAIWNSDQSLMLGAPKTDSNGQISIGLDDGTYKIVSQKAGVEFDVPETMVVTVPATFTYYGTPETYPVPSNPDACNVICDLKDFGLDPKAGVTFTARLTTTPQAISGAILNAEAWAQDTDAAGRAILTLPQGVKFTIFSIALGGDSKTIRIDTAALSSLILADQV